MDWALYGYPDVDRQSYWKSLEALRLAANSLPGISGILLDDRFSYQPNTTTHYVFTWIKRLDTSIGEDTLQDTADALGETLITVDSIRGTQRIVPYLQQRYRILNYLIENK